MNPLFGPVLIVSPHCDDAALSCAALLDRGQPVDVLTVFAGGPDPPVRAYWDELCGFADSDEALRVRREEELAALSPGGHRVTFLDLLEDQYLDGPRDPADAATIRGAVGGWRDRVVAVPVGAGWRPGLLDPILRRVASGRLGIPPHPDHLFARDAVLAAVRGSLLLYEEFPYRRSGTVDGEVARLASSFERKIEPLTLPVNRESKARRLSAYASQLPHLVSPGERLDRQESLPEVERYWLLELP